MTRSVDYAERTDTPSSSMLTYAGATNALTHDTATGLSKALSFTATDTAITGTIARDVRGYVTARTLTGDVEAAWDWTYDAAGRLTGQSGTGLSSSGATYEYGASGKKTGESIALAFGPARTSTFAYTPEGRLEQATIAGQTTRYSFDAAGNLDSTKRGTEPTVTLAYDTAGRIVSMGDVVFGFDVATGRRTSAKRSGEASVTYTWSEAGRLEHFADPARDTSATHAYDGNGQRTTSVVRNGSVTTTTTWTYDGLTLLAYATERSDGATSALTYLTSEGGRPIAGVWSSSEASAPVRFSILTNDRGDVVALTDASGEVFATYGYDAFGAPRPDLTTSRETTLAPHAEAIAAEQPLRYAGYVFDTHSGLYYCSQRYYDPDTMQFLTKDPARADGEESAYQYCGGDPVGKVDPTGLVAYRRIDFVGHRSGYVDVTHLLVEVLSQNAAFARKRRGLMLLGRGPYWGWWASMVGPWQPWDIKRRFDPRNRYRVAGTIYQHDDLGNLHYGFVGHAYGLSLTELLGGGGVAQVVAGNAHARWWKHYFDDPRDAAAIRAGYSLYGRWPLQPFFGRIYGI